MSHVWVMSHIRKSHVMHMNESVTRMNESCHKYVGVMSLKNKSCHSLTRHVTYTEPEYHVTYTEPEYHEYEAVFESCHSRTSHVTQVRDMSHRKNQSIISHTQKQCILPHTQKQCIIRMKLSWSHRYKWIKSEIHVTDTYASSHRKQSACRALKDGPDA